MSEWERLWQQHTVKAPKTALAAAVTHLAARATDTKPWAARDHEIVLDFLRWRYTPLGLAAELPGDLTTAQTVAARCLAAAPKALQALFVSEIVWNVAHPAWLQQLWVIVAKVMKVDELVAEVEKRLAGKNELHAINALMLPYFVFGREEAIDDKQSARMTAAAKRWEQSETEIVRQAAQAFVVPRGGQERAREQSAGAETTTATASPPADLRTELTDLYVKLGGGARQVKAVRTGATSQPITRGRDPKLAAEPFVDKMIALDISDEVLPVLRKLEALPDAMRTLFMEGLFNAVDAGEARDILAQAKSVLPE